MSANTSQLSAIERVADLARYRFGAAAVRKASLLDPGPRASPALDDLAGDVRSTTPNRSGV